MIGPTAFPLCWPESQPRWTGSRHAGAFKSTLTSALNNVRDSLRLFGENSGKPVSEVIISSNVTLGANRPADPGVAVWFTWEGNQVCIPVDRYSTVEANLQAIHHVLEARRTELRHGTLALVRATMKGFIALPAPAKRPWRVVLGLSDNLPATNITMATITNAYRAMAAKSHPDTMNGSHDAMAELNAARDQAIRELNL